MFSMCRASLALVVFEYAARLCRYTHSGDDWHRPSTQVESKQATWRQVCIYGFILTSISISPHRPQRQWRNRNTRHPIPESGSMLFYTRASISMGISLIKACLARVCRPALATIDRAENTPRSVSSGTQAHIQYEWGKCRKNVKAR